MTMDFKSVKLELKLIYSKIGRRVRINRDLTKSSWNPKLVEVPPGSKMLVISPHPDDDAIGLGGTMIKMQEKGMMVRVVYLSLPLTDAPSREERRRETLQALEIMGMKDFYIPDGDFPESGILRDLLVKEMRDYSADVVFMPSPLENHDQHLQAFSSYLEALNIVGEVNTALYEVWGTVVPNMVVDITNQAQKKAKAIAAHASQIKKIDYVNMAKGLNQYRAISCGVSGQAEAFLFLDSKEMIKAFGGR
jgi:LmbE family N-acetylglucosaminyl deacetylase